MGMLSVIRARGGFTINY